MDTVLPRLSIDIDASEDSFTRDNTEVPTKVATQTQTGDTRTSRGVGARLVLLYAYQYTHLPGDQEKRKDQENIPVNIR